MSDECDDLLFQCEPFSGTARLFPLPNLVLFPHVLQPLHVFEPRYRELVEESLAGDRLIAMALLSPGWETDYDGRPPLYPSACLGRIATYHRFEDGRYNLLLAGLQRIRLVRELEPAKPFREAEAVACQDVYSVHRAGQRPALQRCLLDAFRRLAPEVDGVEDSLGVAIGQRLIVGRADRRRCLCAAVECRSQTATAGRNRCRPAGRIDFESSEGRRFGPILGRALSARFQPELSVLALHFAQMRGV